MAKSGDSVFTERWRCIPRASVVWITLPGGWGESGAAVVSRALTLLHDNIDQFVWNDDYFYYLLTI